MTRRGPARADDVDPDADERCLPDLLTALTATLQATEELPVAPAASVWLGEAHAVAEDLSENPPEQRVVRERVGHVQHLLTNAGDLGNDAVATHVTDALNLTETILERIHGMGDEAET